MKHVKQGQKRYLIILLIAFGLSSNIFINEISAQSQKKLNKSLFKAVRNGKIDKAEKLISQGADVNYVPPDGYGSVLCMPALQDGFDAIYIDDAKEKKETLEMVNMLVSHGADVNYKSNVFTPLGMAITFWGNNVAKELIKLGADVNEEFNTENKLYIIEYASNKGNLEMVEYLRNHGAEDLDTKNKMKIINEYEIGVLTIDQFFNDGWEGINSAYGWLDVFAGSHNGNTTKIILGWYYLDNLPSGFKTKKGNISYKVQYGWGSNDNLKSSQGIRSKLDGLSNDLQSFTNALKESKESYIWDQVGGKWIGELLFINGILSSKKGFNK